MNGSNETDKQIAQAYALLEAGRMAEAAELADILSVIAPAKNEVKELLIDVAMRQGDGARVVEMLEPMISASPRNHKHHGKAGVAFALAGDLGAAPNHPLQAIQLKPDYLHALLDLCKVARTLGRYDEAIQAGKTAVALHPDGPTLHSNLALSYELYGLHQKAREHYERAAILCPGDADTQQKAGVACLFTGAKDEAKESFEKAVARNPRLATAYRAITMINNYVTKEHEDFTRLQTLLDTPDATDDDRCQFHFAPGKMYDDYGEYDCAFEHSDAGNRLENRKHDFNPSQHHRCINRLIKSFSAEFMSSTGSSQHTGSQPVFIVGMPRSGTTLVETILACHPGVCGAGELAWMNMLQNALPSFLKSVRPYTECLVEITAAARKLLADKYLDYLGDLTDHGQYSYISDKMPDNYERVGLIWLLFPNARIIWCKRNPLDNAISQFNLFFQGRYGYTCDLFNLGMCYTEMERLMEHWKSVRPQQIHEIQYETLVREQEQQTRRLLEFLDLPWNERCLKFFESDRSIHTASHSQVRKPIYSDSIGRWKHYEKHLEPLHRGLR